MKSEHFGKSQPVTSLSPTLCLSKWFQSFSSLESPISPVSQASLTQPFATMDAMPHISRGTIDMVGCGVLGSATLDSRPRKTLFSVHFPSSLPPFLPPKPVSQSHHGALLSSCRMTPYSLTYTLTSSPISVSTLGKPTFLLSPSLGSSSPQDMTECMTSWPFVIYNNKYILDLPPVPGTELLKPLEFTN